MDTTDGWLLNRTLRYSQPADGFRTGIEPVLLAASIPARAGNRVLEAGTGAGAGLMCLVARVPGVVGVGLEVDPAMAALARRNIEANGMTDSTVVTDDIRAWRSDGRFDHAFANPPWHDPAATPSPIARRTLATHEGSLAIEGWLAAMRPALTSGGTLTIIVPGRQIGRTLSAFRHSGFGALAVVPLWPQAGRDAKLILVSGQAGSRGPDRLTPGLQLHDANGRFSAVARTILESGGPLVI